MLRNLGPRLGPVVTLSCVTWSTAATPLLGASVHSLQAGDTGRVPHLTSWGPGRCWVLRKRRHGSHHRSWGLGLGLGCGGGGPHWHGLLRTGMSSFGGWDGAHCGLCGWRREEPRRQAQLPQTSPHLPRASEQKVGGSGVSYKGNWR